MATWSVATCPDGCRPCSVAMAPPLLPTDVGSASMLVVRIIANASSNAQRGQALMLISLSPITLWSWSMRREGGRSEEHTFELQSLMRISYAVFCSKQKSNTHKRRQSDTIIH